jgi:hypothetical protein
VAVLQALKTLANAARAEGDGGIMVCIAECILACLASLVEVRAVGLPTYYRVQSLESVELFLASRFSAHCDGASRSHVRCSL